MKKLLVVLAILSLSGIAFGAGIPLAVDPQNSSEVWTQEVYNNSGQALSSGMVVIWDFNNVTTPAAYTDRCMYIVLASNADDIRVAGVVVDPSIPITGIGTIAIYGPVYALTNDLTDAVTASQTVALSAADGQCGQATAATVNSGQLGYAISAAPNTVANGGYGGTDGADYIMTPIMVNISVE